VDTGLSFFVEDIGAAAARAGMEWLDIESQPPEDLDRSQLALFSLFQFMVGNTDWSVVAASEGERCCHNVAVLGAAGKDIKTLLPFDFDHSGLVNAPYASPQIHLPIRRVTQRLYRGFCWCSDFLPAAIAVFNEKRPEIERLFSDERLPDPKARKRAWKYINEFYETINDPKKVQRHLLGRCR
jgi:hypothetical protein